MTRDEDLEIVETAIRDRVLQKLRHPSRDEDVVTEPFPLRGVTVVGWAWMDGDREVTRVERMHFIDAARWRDQVAQLARNDHTGGAS